MFAKSNTMFFILMCIAIEEEKPLIRSESFNTSSTKNLTNIWTHDLQK